MRVRDALKYSLEHPGHQGAAADRHRERGRAWPSAWAWNGTRAQDAGRRRRSRWAPSASTCSTWPAAYGALANGGMLAEPFLIAADHRPRRQRDLRPRRPMPPSRSRPLREDAAYLVTDILADNTDPATTLSGARASSSLTDAGRRPATLKTGTTNDFRTCRPSATWRPMPIRPSTRARSSPASGSATATSRPSRTSSPPMARPSSGTTTWPR